MKMTVLHKFSRNLSLKTLPLIFPSCLLVACLLLPQYGIAVEKPSRDMIVAFCEDTDGPQLSADEVQEIVEYIGIPGTAGQLKSLYQVHLSGLLDKLSAENDNAINLKLFGGPLKEVPTYEFSCRKAFRAHIGDVYLTPEEQEAKRIATEKQAEEERLLAEKKAEEERLLAEKKANDYKPIFKAAPVYPRRAVTRGISGYCVLEYTVTTKGEVQNPQPVDCKPEGYFERASITAVQKFKYRPRMVDGEPVGVPGVQNTFTFELE